MPQVPINILGYTTTVGTGFVAICGTLYTEQTTDAQRSVVSSSVSDAAAGTGARTLRITYYDQTLVGPFTEDVVLNGTTPVDTTNVNICFIESIEILTVGAAGGNVGTISLKAAAAGGGATVGSIAPGDNRTQWAHHYIAQEQAASIFSFIGAIKGIAAGEVHMRVKTPTIANTPEQNVAPVMRLAPGTQAQIPFAAPVVVFGPARVTLYAKSSLAVSQDWQASFGLEG